MIGQLFVFFVAGYETTASTVSNNLLLMLRNPKYIQKLREEADRVEVVDMNSLSYESMPWTCAIVAETLRLAAPVGFHLRKAVIDFELPIQGITFKNGFQLEVPVDLLHTHPQFWEK